MSRAASVFPQDATQLHIPQDGPNQGSEAPNTTWHIETADDRADLILAKHTSLALDSSGKPYITYCWVSSFNCDGLYLARYDGSIWHHSTVLSGPYNGAHNSVAIGSEDHPHISAVQELSKLGYAYYDGAYWHHEEVDQALYAVAYTYFDNINTAIKYAYEHVPAE